MGLFDEGTIDPNNPFLKGLQGAYGATTGPQPLGTSAGGFIPAAGAGISGTPTFANQKVQNPALPLTQTAQGSSLFPSTAQASPLGQRSFSQGPAPQQGGNTIDWSQIAGASPEYGQNLQPGDPGRKAWQQYVGNAENAIQNAERRGYTITGNIPSMFRGDISQLNRYGQYGVAGNAGVFVPHNVGPADIRPFTSDELNQINDYQNFAYGQQNLPGGGAVGAWSNYLGQGGDPWGGAYQAYWANKAIQSGVAPGAGFGTGTTAASSPLGYGPNGSYFNQLNGGRQYFNQYGIPMGGNAASVTPGAPGTPNAPNVAPVTAPVPQVTYNQARLPITAPTTSAQDEEKKRQMMAAASKMKNTGRLYDAQS